MHCVCSFFKRLHTCLSCVSCLICGDDAVPRWQLLLVTQSIGGHDVPGTAR